MLHVSINIHCPIEHFLCLCVFVCVCVCVCVFMLYEVYVMYPPTQVIVHMYVHVVNDATNGMFI